MNREEINDLMADYLGGEMSAVQKSLFEKSLAEHPDLAGEVSALAKTLSTLRFAEPATVSAGVDSTGKQSARKSRITTWCQLAAALLIAFSTGFLSHDYLTADRPDSAIRTDNAMREDKIGPTEDSGRTGDREWERVFARAYDDQTSGSTLAKSWIAFSRTMAD
jgi:anti-sigma factor RsiW